MRLYYNLRKTFGLGHSASKQRLPFLPVICIGVDTCLLGFALPILDIGNRSRDADFAC